MDEAKIERTKAFMERLPQGLSRQHRRVMIREFVINRRDFSYALNDAIAYGASLAQQEAKEAKK